MIEHNRKERDFSAFGKVSLLLCIDSRLALFNPFVATAYPVKYERMTGRTSI